MEIHKTSTNLINLFGCRRTYILKQNTVKIVLTTFVWYYK